MALSPGARCGSYEIISALGAGGMGEVYRARDTKLGRDVAIKILSEGFDSDPERIARFQREAHVLASLNHPNIAAIYGLEDPQSGASPACLVMELVDGEDLSERISRGAMPLDEALPVARQIAEALEAAHEHGIIHRDLKPANVKLRTDGMVKVLDFGLAKLAEAPDAALQVSGLAIQSPTITTPAMTQAGMILGTAAYMSPEQAKGRQADKRSDVWAFGCVLYEMVTGQRAFKGDDVADTLAMVLKGDVEVAALPSSVPPAIRELIVGCLRKDRRQRIGDISTVLYVLGQPPAGESQAGVSPAQGLWRWSAVAVAAGLLGAAIAYAVIGRAEPQALPDVTRFAFTLPQEQQLTTSSRAVAISPDGTRIVYVVNGGLFMRTLSEFEGRPIPGAEVAGTAAFSPDGQSLVFYSPTNRSIRRTPITGGTGVTISRVESTPGSLAWTPTGIVYSDPGHAIMRVADNGGKPEILVDLRKSEDLAYGPHLLADGDTVLFTIVKRTDATIGRWETQVVAQSIKTGARTPVVAIGSDARYVATGHIVYWANGTIFAAPFDLTTLAVTGATVPLVEGVRVGATSAGRPAHFAVSQSGSLVYLPGPASADQQELMLFDRSGSAEALKLPPSSYEFPRVSPDGTRIAFGTVEANRAVVSIYELAGASVPRRLTFAGDGNNRFPVWSADGRHVAYQSDRGGDLAVYWQSADGATPAVRLTTPEPGTVHVPESASADGDALLFSATKDSKSSLWVLSLKSRKATPFGDVRDLTLPPDAMFSPDGRWVAYQVGQLDLVEADTYIQPFPPTGTRARVAQGGRPLWSRDGKEIFVVPALGRLNVVAVNTEATPTFKAPVAVRRGFGAANPSTPRTFDLMPDGRILGIGTSDTSGAAEQVRVVVNWIEELKAKAPVK
jgi:serine/threonine-protein kinase